MPSTKRQRTSRGSSASSRADSERSGSESPRLHKSARLDIYEDKENSDPVEYVGRVPHKGCNGETSPPKSKGKTPFEYICFHRPLFDVDGENWRKWSEGNAERLEKQDLFTQLYKPVHIEEKRLGIWAASPAKHKNHKWVIMWSAWLKFDDFCGRAENCDPNNFNMHLYTSWKGWGMQEIIDNSLIDFDKAFKQKGDLRLNEMWATVSALGLWMNVEDVSELINNEDGEKTCELIGLLGCALLTALSAIDLAGELKPSSRFLDLSLVIGYFLELSHDLPAYGIEGSCVLWRKEAVNLFKKGKLDPRKGLFDTDCRLKGLEDPLNNETCNSDDETDDEGDAKSLHRQHGTDNDPWAWAATMEEYSNKYGDTIRLQQYDITKLPRIEREKASLKRKNPLSDIPVKDSRRNVLDVV